MTWRWLKRRRLTIGLVVFFASWYLVQRYVLHAFGAETAIWWFYFDGAFSPGYLLAPISHNMVGFGHLGANIGFLLLFGGLAEPHLSRRPYVVLLLGISLGSIVAANALSSAFGTQWTLAGPSGGILGLWAYISVRRRTICWDSLGSEASSHPAEAGLVAVGLLTPILVPGWEVYSTGAVNVSHAAGVLLGYVIAIVEITTQLGK